MNRANWRFYSFTKLFNSWDFETFWVRFKKWGLVQSVKVCMQLRDKSSCIIEAWASCEILVEKVVWMLWWWVLEVMPKYVRRTVSVLVVLILVWVSENTTERFTVTSNLLFHSNLVTKDHKTQFRQFASFMFEWDFLQTIARRSFQDFTSKLPTLPPKWFSYRLCHYCRQHLFCHQVLILILHYSPILIIMPRRKPCWEHTGYWRSVMAFSEDSMDGTPILQTWMSHPHGNLCCEMRFVCDSRFLVQSRQFRF